jgi:RNA polymerase sigma factor (sigma-70 family)
VVLAVGQSSNPEANAALEKLCLAYWYPLYVYVRRRGYSPEDAQDLTQSFFERLLERDLLADLRPAGARFRSFLLHTMKNLLASEWTRIHAAKRGGANTILSLEELTPETHYREEAVDTVSPDVAFERRWAHAVLQHALNRLRQEQVAAGKGDLFNSLADSLTGAAPSQPHAQLAQQLGTTEAAVKMAIHRLRQRFGELLRLEVAQTVVTPAEIDEELRHLLSVLAQI